MDFFSAVHMALITVHLSTIYIKSHPIGKSKYKVSFLLLRLISIFSKLPRIELSSGPAPRLAKNPQKSHALCSTAVPAVHRKMKIANVLNH
jgi:hypothetical protein